MYYAWWIRRGKTTPGLEKRFQACAARFDKEQGFTGQRLRVEQIAHHEHLRICERRLRAGGGLAPGADGLTYDDFSPSEVCDVLRDLSRIILEGRYRPQPVREVKIPKAGGHGTRTLRIGHILDRIVGKAVDAAFKGMWEKRFSPWSHGYRPRRSGWRFLAELEVFLQKGVCHALAIDDIKNAFDNVPLDLVLDLHKQALNGVKQAKFCAEDKARALALVTSVLRGHNQKRKVGIDQGNPYSPAALNVLLDHYHDKMIAQTISKDLRWLRYADNVVYLCQSKADGQQVLQESANLLQPLGMTLKGKDGVVDLLAGEKAHLMGFDLRWNGKALIHEISPESIADLHQHLLCAHHAHYPSRTALAVVTGWVRAYAPAIEDGYVAEVLCIAAQHGFRERLSPAVVKASLQSARDQWKRCRAFAQCRLRPS